MCGALAIPPLHLRGQCVLQSAAHGSHSNTCMGDVLMHSVCCKGTVCCSVLHITHTVAVCYT